MKKGIGLLLVLLMIMTTALPAMAETKDSKELEQAILKVKETIGIPEEYEEFEYSIQDQDADGQKRFSFNWETKDGKKTIYAVVNEQNTIENYRKYDDAKEQEGIGSVTKEMAEKTAQEFLGKVRPDLAKNMRLIDSDGSSERQELNYRLYVNEIEVSFMNINIMVDKFTGEVTYYDDATSELPNLPDKTNLIDENKAKAELISMGGVELKYYSHFNYETKDLSIFTAYGYLDDNSAIDAKTGKKVWIYQGNGHFDGGGSNLVAKESASGDQSARTQMSKAELEAVGNTEKLISKEQAMAVCKSSIPNFKEATKSTSAVLLQDGIDKKKYIWELGFDGAYVTLDARNGELISFHLYQEQDVAENNTSKSVIKEQAAYEKAEAYLKNLTGVADKFSQTRNITSKNPNESKDTPYLFTFERMVDGIPFANNKITIAVDQTNGNIVRFQCQWYDNVSFPQVKQSIGAAKAVDLMDENSHFDLSYVKTAEKEVTLVYRFTDHIEYYIDALEGKKLKKDGSIYREQKVPTYTDLTGHWCEPIVNSLLENGYYLADESFKPKEAITQERFLRYLYSPQQSWYDSDEFYEMLQQNDIIKEGEKAATAELKRQDAAKFAVRYLGQGKSAEHPEIFVNPFADEVSEIYRGYAAICYGLGIMKGDTNGRFNGESSVSNGEAAAIIYQLLLVK